MALKIILSIAAVGLLWGGWPLVLRAAGESNRMINFITSLSATLLLGLFAINSKSGFPSLPNLWRITIAGAMIGLGLAVFNYVATQPKVALSTVVPIINSSMLFVTVMGGAIFFSEGMTLKKVIGIALLILGIILLRPDKAAS